VKLLDFGVAKARDRSSATRDGVVKGSVQYMSPDHVAAEPIDARADVFAAGVLLREILCGEKLWPEDKGDLEIVRHLMAKEVPPFPASALGRTSPVLRGICWKATRADRDERFATALEMKKALDAWLAVEDPRGSLAELGETLRSELDRATVSVSSSALVTRVSGKTERPSPDRRVAVVSVCLAIAALVAVVAWPKQDGEGALPRPSPRVEIPTMVHFDSTPRRVAPPPPSIDRFDPGY
jgi:serine/threonine-protein kinase